MSYELKNTDRSLQLYSQKTSLNALLSTSATTQYTIRVIIEHMFVVKFACKSGICMSR